MSVSVGGDPEVPILNAKGLAIPAHARDFSPKQKPTICNGGYLLRDGWAVELNPAWSYCRETFANNVNDCFFDIKKRLQKGEYIAALPVAEIDTSYLKDAPEDVMLVGCDKSWNAYTQKEGAPDNSILKSNLRCFGGHAHFGFNSQEYDQSGCFSLTPQNAYTFVKLIDLYDSLPNVYITGSKLAGVRRKWYGQAGEFRYQHHFGENTAIEYRVWGPEVYSHPALLSFHLGVARWVAYHFEELSKIYSPKYESQVQEIINTGTSREDILDLMPKCPDYYPTLSLLKKAKKYFQHRMHKPITEWRYAEYGWDYWSAKHGVDLWDHRR